MPNIRPLSTELALKAQKELNEVPERIQEDLDAVRAWLKKQPHINARTDDQFLILFLRGCKYSIERVKEKIDMYYTLRTAVPELMRNRDPFEPQTAAIIRLGAAVFLPSTNGPGGPRIMLVRPGVCSPDLFTMQQVMKTNMLLNDIAAMEDDNFIVAGQIGLADMKNVTMRHLLQFNPTFMKKMAMLGQEGSPFRQKGMHHINTPGGFETIFNMFKTFMNAKNQSRIYVYGDNFDALYEHIPKRLLPTEYGGDAGPIQNIIDDWEKKLQSYAQYFKDDEQYGTNEKLRPGRPKNSEALFGVDGTFRKLNVD